MSHLRDDSQRLLDSTMFCFGSLIALRYLGWAVSLPALGFVLSSGIGLILVVLTVQLSMNFWTTTGDNESSSIRIGTVHSFALIIFVLMTEKFVVDFSADAGTIHYPIARALSDPLLNPFEIENWEWAPRIDVGLGVHVMGSIPIFFGFDKSFLILPHLMLLYVAAIRLRDIGLQLRLKYPRALALAGVGSFSLLIQQFFLGYQDLMPGLLLLAGVVQLLSLALTWQEQSPIGFLQFLVVVATLCILKSTFVVSAVLLTVAYLCLVSPRRILAELSETSRVMTSVLSAVITILLSPAIWVMFQIARGNPPLFARSGVLESAWSGSPDWMLSQSRLSAILSMYLSETSLNPDEKSNFGFMYLPTRASISSAGLPDSRLAGFGPLAGRGTLFLVVAALVIALSRDVPQKMKRRFVVVLAVVTVPPFLLPLSFNYRYFPHYSILPIVLLIFILALRKSSTSGARKTSTAVFTSIGLALFAVNSSIIAWSTSHHLWSWKGKVNEIREIVDDSPTTRLLYVDGRFGMKRYLPDVRISDAPLGQCSGKVLFQMDEAIGVCEDLRESG